MSTCPEKDIHMLYVDNELPISYIGPYKKHVEGCEKCQKILSTLTKMHEAFAADSAAETMSEKQLDDSFARLSARLSYSRTISTPHDNEFIRQLPKIKQGAKYIATAAAAAAVILLLPIKGRTTTVQTQIASDFQPVTRPAPIHNAQTNQVKFNTSLDAQMISTIMTALGQNYNDLQIQAVDASVPVEDSSMAFTTKKLTTPSNNQMVTLSCYDVFGNLLSGQFDDCDEMQGVVSLTFTAPIRISMEAPEE